MEIGILYEDRDLIVCEKPVGILSEGDAAHPDRDMITLLSAHGREKGEKGSLHTLHRLDRNVGGLMVYAKNSKAAAGMSNTIAAGKMKKEYIAVCHGDVATSLGQEGELFDLLFKDSRTNKSFVTNRMRRGVKDAHLSYRVLAVKTTSDGVFSLVRIRLGTGRTHQIRVQFSSRRHPLVGDGKYGSRSNDCEVALFACALAFDHPTTHRPLAFEAPLPQGYPWALFSDTITTDTDKEVAL